MTSDISSQARNEMPRPDMIISGRGICGVMRERGCLWIVLQISIQGFLHMRIVLGIQFEILTYMGIVYSLYKGKIICYIKTVNYIIQIILCIQEKLVDIRSR